MQIPLNKLPYHRPGNFDDNPGNFFQIRNPNHSSKPNNKGRAEPRPRTPIIRPPKEKRRKNKEIEYPAFDVFEEKRRNNEEIDFPGFDVLGADLPNNRKFNSEVYQDDPPPLIRPPSPGARRNPEVCNKLAREIYDGHRVYAVWHYRVYKIRKIFAKKSTYPKKIIEF